MEGRTKQTKQSICAYTSTYIPPVYYAAQAVFVDMVPYILFFLEFSWAFLVTNFSLSFFFFSIFLFLTVYRRFVHRFAMVP